MQNKQAVLQFLFIMKLPILFQSLDRINGREGRSKLIHSDSDLYTIIHALKKEISKKHTVGDDRMDLHIEISKERRDPEFRTKAESLHEKVIDLSKDSSWGFLGRAFVIWTPEVADYGKTHMTVSFFGNNAKPSESELIAYAQEFIQKQAIKK